MANDLDQMIKKLESGTEKEKVILRFDTWSLTKSAYVKGSQCLKYLFLDKHKKHERTPISIEKRKLFKRGHSFENLVREKEFPGGKNIKDEVSNFAFFNSYTEYLLNTKQSQILYEATIIEENVLVMCDVLTKNDNGFIDVYEIKLSTAVNDAIMNDLCIQYLVCKKRFGNKLNAFNVILRSDEIGEEWRIVNLKSELEKRVAETERKLNILKATLLKQEPMIPMGEQCNLPYECAFIDYCKNKC